LFCFRYSSDYYKPYKNWLVPVLSEMLSLVVLAFYLNFTAVKFRPNPLLLPNLILDFDLDFDLDFFPDERAFSSFKFKSI